MGLGTIAPADLLEVKSNVTIANDATVPTFINMRQGLSGTYNCSISTYSHNGDAYYDGLSLNGYDGVSICTGANTRQERVRIDSSGKVGIGTTSATASLHVVGNDRLATLLLDGTSQTTGRAGIGISSNVTNGGNVWNIWSTLTGEAPSGGALAIFNNTQNAFRMVINNAGNTGIGTTGPSTKLSVEGATSTTGRNDVGMTLNVNVNDAAFGTTYPNGTPFGVNVQQTQNANFRFCQFNSGYTPNSGGTVDAEFIVYGNGNVTADGSYATPADYAEMFEWEDGNPDNEDRVGYSVVLSSGNKIRKSELTDPPESLIGVVSGRPAICADTAWNRWADKYLKDDFNRYLFENYEVWKWTDESGKEISYDFDKVPPGVIVPENKTIIVQERYILNPNYDPDVAYTPRMKRKEWSPIGMVGKLSLLTGQLTGPRWIKLVDFSPTVSQWLVR
jgi:hypothetical protein